MTKAQIAKRSNCRPILAIHEIHGKIRCFSIGEAAQQTGMCRGTVERLLGNGRHSVTGWKFIYADSEKPKVLILESEELNRVYRFLREQLIYEATHKPYKKDYSWPLYDKIVAHMSNTNNSHDEYEYWRDWDEKNRNDIDEDRYADREDEDE